MIYWGPLKPLERLLLRTVLVPWSYVASIAYHLVLVPLRRQEKGGGHDGDRMGKSI